MAGISWLETDTFSNKNIASAVAIGVYTANADRAVMCQAFVDQAAGNGDYVMYVTLQIGGAGSAYVILPKTTMTAASGETAIGGQSGWINVRSGDVVTVYVDGLAGDTTTPDTTVRWFQVDAAGDVWGATTRTLTQSAASVTSTVSGSDITIKRGDTLSASITGLSDLTDYVSLDFVVKDDRDDTDTSALIWIRLNSSGLNDGLLYFNSASVAEASASAGSITIVSASAGSITIALEADKADDLTVQRNLYYDIQMITATAVTTLTEGLAHVSSDVTRAVS